MNPIQRRISALESELRSADHRLDDLELRAHRERLEGRLRLIREIAHLLREKEMKIRQLTDLRLSKAQVDLPV